MNTMPGGKLEGLTNIAVRLLPPPPRLPNKTHVYFVCCVSDITEKIYSTNREIIYVSDTASIKTNHTTVLYHTDHYKGMQNKINNIIDELNGHLSKLNKKAKMSTPFFHDTIAEYRGCKKDCYMIHWRDLLNDVLHTSDILADKWASVFKNNFRLNRRNDDSDDDNRSPYRPWRRQTRAPRLD